MFELEIPIEWMIWVYSHFWKPPYYIQLHEYLQRTRERERIKKQDSAPYSIMGHDSPPFLENKLTGQGPALKHSPVP